LVDVSILKRFPNVHLLGRKRHDALPNYCKAFSVGIIPYRISERILHVNPLKLREYLSAGLPVVSVPLPELEGYRQYCTIAATFEAFEQGVAEALQTDSPALREQRSAAMRSETWARRVTDIADQVARVQARQRRATEAPDAAKAPVPSRSAPGEGATPRAGVVAHPTTGADRP
jgi:hypothetical protein